MNLPPSITTTLALLITLLAGCAEPPPPPPPAPRPVKVETIGSAAAPGEASFVGTLRDRQRTDLGFETPGRIATIAVDVGDRVRAGQELARLDEAPARWRLDRAEADRAAAAASLAERALQLEQQSKLAREQIISETALETARAQHASALSQARASESALSQARRDLALTRITAPYAGTIVGRTAQPHADIAAGQPVLQIEGGRTLEVVVMLPDNVASRLSAGQAAAGVDGAQRLALKLDRVSARSENGSLVQAIFRVEGNAQARSGGVVSVELARAASDGLGVPAAAVMPGSEPGIGSVYAFDAMLGRVQRRPVKLGASMLPGGRVVVTEGLKAGDQIVVAGTAFLSDGQSAVRYMPQTVLSEARP